MKKTILFFVALILIWVGYMAWPLYDLYRVARAIERRDIETVARHVDFHRTRQSFTQQIVQSYLQRTGARVGPLVQGAAVSIADPLVEKMISRDALAELLRVGWPVGALPDRPHETMGLSVQSLGTLWDVFDSSEYGIGRYEVSVPVTFPKERALGLQFRLAGWRWRLSGVELPQHILVPLTDEIIKQTKPNPTAQ